MAKSLLQGLLMAGMMISSQAALAQSQASVAALWQFQRHSQPAAATAPMLGPVTAALPLTPAKAPQKAASTVESITLGYCGPDDYIYQADGVSLDRDANVGAAIKITKDMLQTYVGGTIRSLRIGWSTSDKRPSIKTFVRSSYNGENLASKTFTPSGTIGWNTVQLDKGVTITDDMDSLFVGFNLSLPKGVYIPTVWPHNVVNSCYLAQEGDVDANGNQNWYDYPDFGKLAILAVVEDPDGKLHDMVKLTDFRYDAIAPADSAGTTLARLTNLGTNDVNSLGVECRQGDKTWEYEMLLSQPVQPGKTAKVSLPLYCFGTGTTEYAVKYVNGEFPRKSFSTTVDQIGVPKAVAEKYTHRPLIEFYTSENSVYGPTYYSYITEGLQAVRSQYSLVKVHAEDQFMTGTDEDDAIRMQLDFGDGDSLQVYIPAMSIDRNAYTCNPAGRYKAIDNILYPQAGAEVYSAVLGYPTFASVNVSGSVAEDASKVSIDVTGDIAEGIMPKDEPLYLSVYLLEKNVKSESQKFWGDEESEQYGGVYTHENVIRRRVTPLYGTKLEKNSGTYTMHFDQRISSKWNADNLSVVAFINRGLENPSDRRQVINSGETQLTNQATGISQAAHEGESRVVAIYNLAGVQQPLGVKPAKGVYLVKRVVNGQTVVTKEAL